MDLLLGRLSQWANYNFNSMVRIGDVHVGANDEGLYKLDSGNSDDVQDIDAFFELAMSDWGIAHQKRIRYFYIGCECNGDLMVLVKNDDGYFKAYDVQPNHTPNQQHSIKVPGSRDGKGRYWTVRIENVNGSDFSIDQIEVMPVILARKPSKA